MTLNIVHLVLCTIPPCPIETQSISSLRDMLLMLLGCHPSHLIRNIKQNMSSHNHNSATILSACLAHAGMPTVGQMPPDAWLNLLSLTELRMSSCRLAEIPALPHMTGLRTLDVSVNKIAVVSIPPSSG
jgi:hypothetical protein